MTTKVQVHIRGVRWKRGFTPAERGDGSANDEHEPELRYERSTRD